MQTVQIIDDGLGEYWHRGNYSPTAKYYDAIVKALCREIGVHKLVENTSSDKRDELFVWMQATDDIDAWLDAVELSLTAIDTTVRSRSNLPYRTHVRRPPDDVINEFNARMQESGIGYRYLSQKIIRVDSEHIHDTLIVPALSLLEGPAYSDANQNYRNAHEAYRRGRLEDCLSHCRLAIENTLRAIARQRGWTARESDPPGRLLQIAVEAGFIAPSVLPFLGALAAPAGLPAAGLRPDAGSGMREFGRPFAAFQLHQTAAMLLYLAEHHVAEPSGEPAVVRLGSSGQDTLRPPQHGKVLCG
ncbi:hypothetical protein J3R73_002870 [Labrys monachus]|uniref:Uncharacterized protein n=1 Tax=Labrys monachus TaxID=217067 RepID=A0ABU0FG38_9HYPH|nr:hypothetical protein [Labrys monachus]